MQIHQMVYFLLVLVLVLSLFYGSIVDERPMLREAKSGNWIGSFIGHEVVFFIFTEHRVLYGQQR